MGGSETEFSRELTRIITCPYPPSLTKLADICARSEAPTIRQSIHDRPPCAITKLASIVSAALPLWQHAAGILQCLCHNSPEFAEAMLIQNPGLLDTLLTKANSSQQGFEEYNEICVILLSRTLPEAVPLPASAQSFFLEVFEITKAAPAVSTLKPIYWMLNGACRGLLDLLPSKARHDFDGELRHILSAQLTSENCMLLLWCIGLVILAEHPDASTTCPNAQQNTPVREWKTASARKLFGDDRKEWCKTIFLIYMSVVWATKGGVGVPDTEAVEGIRIAIRAMQFVSQQAREEWRNSGPQATNQFARLPSKIQRKDVNPAIKLEALCFYAMIVGESSLTPELVSHYQTTLSSVGSLAEPQHFKENLSISLLIFAPRLQEPAIRTILAHILDLNISPRSAQEMSVAKVLVEELATIVPSCAQLGCHLVAALSSSMLQQRIEKFLNINAEIFEDDSRQSCRRFSAVLRRDLVSATVSLLLTSALNTHPGEPTLSHSIGINLINLQRRLPFLPQECSHITLSTPSPTVSLFQQQSTPLPGQPLQDWRARLKTELERQGFYQRDQLIRSVAQICHDLEVRCGTVEEPLRLEQEKSKQVTAEVCELRQKVTSLETKKLEDSMSLQALEDANDKLEKEKKGLFTHCERLKVDLEHAVKKADDALCAARESYDTKELQWRTTTLTRKEELQACEEKISKLHETNSRLSDELRQKSDERESLNNLYVGLQERFRGKEQELESERQTVSIQSDEIVRLKNEEVELEERLQSTKVELVAIFKQLDELQARYQDLRETSDEAVRNMEIGHEQVMQAAASKAAQERGQLNSELQDALRDLSERNKAYEQSQRNLQRLQAIIPPMKAENQKLKDDCLVKDHELEEFRAWRKLIVGIAPPDNPPPMRITSRPDPEPSDPQTPRQHRRRKSAIHTRDIAPKAAQGLTATAEEITANVSFTSSDSHSSRNGPTPKRPRTRPSFKVPAVHTPYAQKSASTSRSFSKKQSPTKRSALGNVSLNRRQTHAGFVISEHEDEEEVKRLPFGKRRGSLDRLEQADYNLEDSMAGMPFTPGQFLAGTGRVPEESATEL